MLREVLALEAVATDTLLVVDIVRVVNFSTGTVGERPKVGAVADRVMRVGVIIAFGRPDLVGGDILDAFGVIRIDSETLGSESAEACMSGERSDDCKSRGGASERRLSTCKLRGGLGDDDSTLVEVERAIIWSLSTRISMFASVDVH